jgi:NAD(P)H-hydrate epimerase
LETDGNGAVPANELLTVEEMYRADAAAVTAGVAGDALMEAAGAAIATHIRNRWARRPVAVLCGPGNNGGDGFVVARLLAAEGWPVTVGLLGERAKLTGDAALNSGRWTGEVRALGPALLVGAELVVDALFGAGLARPPEGAARAVIEAINSNHSNSSNPVPCVAVDIPSGVHGDNGRVMGLAPRCRLTVTFFRRKPGHLLEPGRELCGEVVVADIGIPESTLADIAPRTFANDPGLWIGHYRWPAPGDHKYSRGHAVIAGGAAMTGAARLAARAAMRAGAGMLTIASPPEVLPLYAADRAGVLTVPVANAAEFSAVLTDPRKNAVLIGPGLGVNRTTREMVLGVLATAGTAAGDGPGRAVVLDADAITVFEDDPDTLLAATAGQNCLLTPHEGEFARLFADSGDKLARTRHAALECGAAVLLKGADTVIAAPDGRAVINHNAPPFLATAGAGDVLAGFCLGLMAQGMAGFPAACAAAWLHGEAASDFGPGLVADDLPEALPAVLRRLTRLTQRA